MRNVPRNWMFLSSVALLSIVALGGFDHSAMAQEADGSVTAPPKPQQPFEPVGVEQANLKRLSKDYAVWLDEKNKSVVVGGEVCLTRGVLEMFACIKGTKEHESVVTCYTQAYVVHAALLAAGAEAGKPVQFQPKYVPATGSEVEITVHWVDKKGMKHEAKAQEWVRNMKTEEELKYPWVFAGSGFWQDEDTGKRHYLAESGDFICVSNFPSAMLDLPVESSQTNDSLMYEAFTDRIPERGTKVTLVLKPKKKG